MGIYSIILNELYCISALIWPDWFCINDVKGYHSPDQRLVYNGHYRGLGDENNHIYHTEIKI